MSEGRVRIIAIGGGGCTNRADAAMESWIRSLVMAKRPRFGFLGTASADDPTKLAGFSRSYGDHGEILEAPPLVSSAEELAGWLGKLDLLYVGGGNTVFLLECWKRAGWAAPLAAAARDGLLIAGVSAGGVCWFEAAFSDAGGTGFAPVSGLGVAPGACCPHYSEEPARQPAYKEAIADGRIMSGIAIDDGVAVLCDGEGARGFVSGRPGCAAYSIRRENGGIVQTLLPSLVSP